MDLRDYYLQTMVQIECVPFVVPRNLLYVCKSSSVMLRGLCILWQTFYCICFDPGTTDRVASVLIFFLCS